LQIRPHPTQVSDAQNKRLPEQNGAQQECGLKAKAEKDELLHDTQYLQSEIERVKEEKAKTLQDRMKLEEIARATADRLRCDIRDGLTVKADLETQIYKVKRRQQEQEEENARLRTYLGKCKEDLDRALR